MLLLSVSDPALAARRAIQPFWDSVGISQGTRLGHDSLFVYAAFRRYLQGMGSSSR